MIITIKKLHLAVAVLAVALIAPATAFATHVFEDVEDDRFYSEPVAWASANGITTGTSLTTFDPEDPVTRGESVTFLKRYHDNFGQTGVARERIDFSTTSTTATELTTISVDVPSAGTLLVEIAGQYWLDLDAPEDDAVFGVVQLAICDAPDTLEEADCGTSITDARYEDPDDTNSNNATPGIATSRVVDVAESGTVTFSINGLSFSGAAFNDWFTYAEVTFFADNALAGALTVG